MYYSKILMNFTVKFTLPYLIYYSLFYVYGIKIMQSCDFIWSACTSKIVKPGQIIAFERCAYLHTLVLFKLLYWTVSWSYSLQVLLLVTFLSGVFKYSKIQSRLTWKGINGYNCPWKSWDIGLCPIPFCSEAIMSRILYITVFQFLYNCL